MQLFLTFNLSFCNLATFPKIEEFFFKLLVTLPTTLSIKVYHVMPSVAIIPILWGVACRDGSAIGITNFKFDDLNWAAVGAGRKWQKFNI